jgi:hypothetical protein
MPHLNPLITPFTELGHREPMTINAFASINIVPLIMEFTTSVADSSDPSLSFNPTDCRFFPNWSNPHYWASASVEESSTGKMIVDNWDIVDITDPSKIYRIEESEAGFKRLSRDAIAMSGKFPAGFIMTDGFSIIGIGRGDCWTVQIRHCFL